MQQLPLSSRRILIVGGGIAGFAMIRALARRGIAATVVERLSGPPDAGLGLNLPGNAVRALQALGVGDELRERSVPILRREYRTHWLSSTFGDYPEPVRHAVSSALADPSSLYHSPVEEVRIDSWHRGRVVLIGDAAHATAPVWAQGAALAAEDALVLADLLAERDDWERAGDEFERRRRPRVGHVQKMTDRLSRAAGLPRWLRDAILPVLGPRTYSKTYGPLREPVISTQS